MEAATHVPSTEPSTHLDPGPLRRRSRDIQRRAADIILDVLIEVGVEVVFGLPGGSVAPLYDALLDRPGLHMVTTRQDGNSVFAAAGYAQVTGRLGVAVVTSGPGVLNCMNALGAAYTDGLPVLVLAGEAPRRGHGRGAIQEGSSYSINVVGMASHTTKLAVEVTEASAAAGMLRRAIATALSGCRGPVFVSLPLDVLGQLTTISHAPVEAKPSFELDEGTLEQVVKALCARDRRLLFVGSGARSGSTPQLLRELAERLQVPVVTTPKAKGIFPENHPLSLGVYGMGGHPSARRYVRAGLDTLLVLGSSLNEVATDGWSPDLIPRRCLIHVDVDAARLGRAYPTDMPVAAPAELFLARLLPHIARSSDSLQLSIDHAEDPRALEPTMDGRVSPVRVLWELQQKMPPDTIYTTDSGNNLFFSIHYLVAQGPERFVSFLGLGSMGAGLPAALGVQLAHPDRTVVAIMGDGGFLMAAGELAVAAQHDLPICVLVLNDFRYNMVEHGLRNIYGRTANFPTGPIRVPSIAEGCGVPCIVVEHPGDLLRRLDLSARRGPLVIDARISTATRLPPNSRFETIAQTASTNH